MLAATLAIAGTPGFSGFFSKDEILLAAHDGPYANAVALLAGRPHRRAHFVLHVPPALPHVSWRRSLRRAPHARARIAAATCSCRWSCWRFFPSPADGGPRRIFSAARIYFEHFLAPVFGGAPKQRAANAGAAQRTARGAAGRARDRRAARLSCWRGGSISAAPSCRTGLRNPFRALPPAFRQIFCRRTVRGRDRAPAALDFDDVSVARRRRARHRRHGERHRARLGEIRRPRAPPEFRQHAHLRHLDRLGRGAAHYVLVWMVG